jgi:DNA-directed RNA polymerase specialized sigma24 family protein
MEVNGRQSIGGARELTADAFERLLHVLDADRNRAAEQYERIRAKLVNLFRWRGCLAPEDLADRTFDRVARRLVAGAELRVADPYLYFHGVALNVLREHWREPGREHDDVDALSRTSSAFTDPAADLERLAAHRLAEQRFDCLTQCMKRLPDEARHLIETYHGGAPGEQIRDRKALAEELRVPLNALRIRAHRIRLELMACAEKCLRRSTETV